MCTLCTYKSVHTMQAQKCAESRDEQDSGLSTILSSVWKITVASIQIPTICWHPHIRFVTHSVSPHPCCHQSSYNCNPSSPPNTLTNIPQISISLKYPSNIPQFPQNVDTHISELWHIVVTSLLITVILLQISRFRAWYWVFLRLHDKSAKYTWRLLKEARSHWSKILVVFQADLWQMCALARIYGIYFICLPLSARAWVCS